MPEAEGNVDAAAFGIGIPVPNPVYALKGANNYDWGMKDRLSRIFDPATGNTVMFAFDHGYIMGPTSGLERIDLTILPLIEHADCLMCTRGVLRSCVAPIHNKPIALRCSAGSTVLTELNDECVGVEIEDALRLNASMMAGMVEIGGAHEALTIRNLCRMIETGNRYGVPTLGVTAVGHDMTRDARYLGLASRVLAENGAQVVKTYYCDEGFDRVTAGCPVPIVVAGGRKTPERASLELAYRAIDQGAAGVDMGRNIFQAEHPSAMIRAVRAIVHGGQTGDEAYEIYQDLQRS
jgi:putative autoinducer-2 (AI-2) aldolase